MSNGTSLLTRTVDSDIHAFIGWFDTEFSCLHVPMGFSTGPHAKYTHWKYVALSIPSLQRIELSVYGTYFHLFIDKLFSTPAKPSPSRYVLAALVWHATTDESLLKTNEEINGTIKVSPNARNNRDLDIVINYQHNGSSGSTTETLEFQMCVSLLQSAELSLTRS